MERKPAGDPVTPTGAADFMVPVQESGGAERRTSPLPTILLPPADEDTPVSAQTSDDPLLGNSDYITLKQFVDRRKSSSQEGQGVELNNEELVK